MLTRPPRGPTKKEKRDAKSENERACALRPVHCADGGGGLYQDSGAGGALYPAIPVYHAGGPAAGRPAWGHQGLPIFTEGGGFWYLLKPSFGYILGFIVGAYVTGKMAAKTSNFWHILGANLVGLIIVYGMGMVYYYIICNFVLGTPIGLWPLVLYCFLLAVPGDLCLCVLAAAVTVRLRVALPGLSRA